MEGARRRGTPAGQPARVRARTCAHVRALTHFIARPPLFAKTEEDDAADAGPNIKIIGRYETSAIFATHVHPRARARARTACPSQQPRLHSCACAARLTGPFPTTPVHIVSSFPLPARFARRWSDLCGAQGVCICETDDGSAIAAWGANWAPMSEIEVTPVLDDMATRAVLSSKPMYQK